MPKEIGSDSTPGRISLFPAILIAVALCFSPALGLGQTDPLGQATALNRQAIVLYNQGRHAEAEPLYRRSLAIREKALGPDHPEGIEVSRNPSVVLERLGRAAAVNELRARYRGGGKPN
ncbi:MAG: tetratricopeptide repeat protein [Pseudomonadota bacterium]